MAKKMGEQIYQVADKIANKDIKWEDNLSTVLDSKGGFSKPPKDYLPYGKEWEKEMMKVPKKYIIDMVRNKQVEIDNLRNKQD
jgi:phage-related minor tail protein